MKGRLVNCGIRMLHSPRDRGRASIHVITLLESVGAGGRAKESDGSAGNWGGKQSGASKGKFWVNFYSETFARFCKFYETAEDESVERFR